MYRVFAHIDYFSSISWVKELQLATCLATLGRFDGRLRAFEGRGRCVWYHTPRPVVVAAATVHSNEVSFSYGP